MIQQFIKIHYNRFFVILGILIGLIQSIRLAWVSDDAYISFIYCRNLWEGNGLVFNIGEKVEGFSNFLWTIVLSLSFPLGMRIEDFAIGLGICFYFFTLLAIKNPALILSYSLFFHGAIFATSGLETALFGLLILVSYQLWKNQEWAMLALVSAILVLVRPDGAIFAVFHFIVFSIEFYNGERMNLKLWRNRLSLLGFVILVFVFLGKVFYYGELVPNTYWAKAAEGEYWAQGFYYFFLFQKEYPAYALLLLIGLIFSRSVYSYAILIYITYVLYIGGDFMFARFIVPIIPVVSVLAWDKFLESSHIWKNRLETKGNILSYLLLGFFILSPLITFGYMKKNKESIYLESGIVEERDVYKGLGTENLEYDAEALKDMVVSFWGAQAHFIYYMRPRLAIESSTGLTDFYLARRTIIKRGRIGHEKEAPLEYLISREVNIIMSEAYPELGDKGRTIVYNWNGHPLHWKVYQLSKEQLLRLEKNPNFNTESLNPSLWER
jgi:hypothetical protein